MGLMILKGEKKRNASVLCVENKGENLVGSVNGTVIITRFGSI